jgi:hypothetical protein
LLSNDVAVNKGVREDPVLWMLHCPTLADISSTQYFSSGALMPFFNLKIVGLNIGNNMPVYKA